MGEKLLREKEAAELMGFSVKTLRQWRWQHRGPEYLRSPLGAIRYKETTCLKHFQSVNPTGQTKGEAVNE